MEIVSISYALLAITSILVFYALNHKYRIWYLTLLSLGFLAGINFYLLVYIIGYSLFNYYLGQKIPVSVFRKTLFRIGIIVNLSQLILLKYASFAIEPVFQIFGCNLHITKFSEIIVPLGISYFTLQGMGYLINIKMGWEKPEQKFLYFLLYIVFYPKFLSGPIERSNHFLPQLKVFKSFDEKEVTEGLKIALFGFFKKIVIANQLGTFVTHAYSDISSFGGLNLWVVVLIQPLYLYFDFSGYTDIAVGITKIYGIDLLPNFNKPFLAENVTTFWKRFHMSLSLWFNDYVFKQVSFKYRKLGKYASVLAVFVTFTLFGIWHGSGWNFMALGLIQALAINFEFFTKKKRINVFSKIPYPYRLWIGRLLTYFFFGISLILFFSSDLSSALTFFTNLFKYNNGSDLSLNITPLLTTIISLCLLSILLFELIENDYNAFYQKIVVLWCRYKFIRLVIYYLILFLILYLIGGKQEFIYSKF